MGILDTIGLGSLARSGSIADLTSTVIIGVIFVVIVVSAVVMIRNKLKYTYFGEIERRRQGTGVDGDFNPGSKKLQGKAGYFNSKGKTVFRIKHGFGQKVELSKLPDPKYMIDNTVFYLQLNKDNLVQAKKKIDWKFGGVELVPVEDDMKYGAALDMMEKGNILSKKSVLERYGGQLALTIIFVSSTVGMWFMSKTCGA